MTRRFLAHALTVSLILGAALPARAWTAQNGMRVQGSAQSITVRVAPGNGSSQIICAAADYAVERLGAAPGDALTVVVPRSARIDGRGGDEVGFRLVPGGSPSHGLLLRVSQPGTTVKIAHARKMCGDSRD